MSTSFKDARRDAKWRPRSEPDPCFAIHHSPFLHQHPLNENLAA